MFSSVRTTSLTAATTRSRIMRVGQCLSARVCVCVRADRFRKTHALMCILCVYVVCNGQPYRGLYAVCDTFVYAEAAAIAPAAANRQAQRIDDCRRAVMWVFCSHRCCGRVWSAIRAHFMQSVRERESPSPPPPQRNRTVGRNICT